MAINKTVIQKYLRAGIGMNPVEVTYSGTVFNGLKSIRADTTEMKVAGLLPSYKFSVYLDFNEVTDWENEPTIGQTVDIDNVTYRILEISNDPADVYIRLDLGGQYDG